MAKTLVLSGTDFSTNKLATVTFDESVPCTGLSLDQSTKSVTSMSSFTLTATPTPSNTTDPVTWATSNSSIATVANGVVTPAGLGTVTITATCGSYSAMCAVTIDNVVPSYVAVCGYSPYRRTSTGNAATTGKKDVAETNQFFILAANQSTGLYPIESKTDVDTSPFRFVPILIPKNATKIVINSTNASLGKLKTLSLYFDSTKPETTYNTGGAYCVYGSNGNSWDQGSTQNPPIELTIPDDVAGLDSCCFALLFKNAGTYGEDYSSDISIKFTYGE